MLSVLVGLCPATARADLGVSTAIGTADHHTSMVDVALVWDPDLHFWQLGGWDFSLRGELHAAWLHNSEGDDPRSLGAFGVTPLIRFGKMDGMIRPYVEAGVGFRLLTGTQLNSSYDISTAFQFADMVGAGLKFGNRGQYELGYRFEHVSNASIKRPNPGINFHQIRFGYFF